MDVLHDKVNALCRRGTVDALVKFHDLRMLQLAEDLDFSESRFFPLNVHNPLVESSEYKLNFDP